MAYTEDDIIALESAIKRGVRTVRTKDNEVTYQSLTDMRNLLAEIKAEVRGQTAESRYTTFTTGKGV